MRPLDLFVENEIASVGFSQALRDPLHHVDVVGHVLERTVVRKFVEELANCLLGLHAGESDQRTPCPKVAPPLLKYASSSAVGARPRT